VVELIEHIDAGVVRANMESIGAEIESAARAAGRSRDDVEIVAAVKYLPASQLPALADAGIAVAAENRAQELQAKAGAPGGERLQWDFIGQLQSRRVRLILPVARLIHSVASESALRELERRRELARPGLRILLEVNVSGEPGKAGIAPAELPTYLASAPLPVAGLMTMPPLASDPEQSRPYFAALRELGHRHSLEHLSMGTSQDYTVAVEEGATIVRIGTSLYS
jgi:pyridoxal phosphate enzyme (YggS family)